MKKQIGNMYPDVETWNPLAGECPHKCVYCSTKSLMRYPVIKAKYSGPLRLDYCVYKKLTGKNRTIFVCAQNDLFAKEVPELFIYTILSQCNLWNQNTYFFQTKNPARMKEFATLFPEKTILCTTIETNRKNKFSKAPDMWERVRAMNEHWLAGFTNHITIEPICDFDLEDFIFLIKECHPGKVNIGADSKHHNLPEPSKEKLLALINELQKFTTIDRKTNLARLLK